MTGSWNRLTLSSASEVDIANEFGDGATFVLGETVLHNHILGEYRKVRAEVLNVEDDSDVLAGLPHCVKAALRQRLDLEEDDDSKDVQISEMSAEERFEGYCEWEGLINWAGTLSMALDGIRSHHLSIMNGVPTDASWEAMKPHYVEKAGK